MIPAPYLTSGDCAAPGSAATPPTRQPEVAAAAVTRTGEGRRSAAAVDLAPTHRTLQLTTAGWKAALAPQVQWLVDLVGGEKR